MVFAELETHLTDLVGLPIDRIDVGGQPYTVIRNLRIPNGSHEGETCEVAILRSDENPWLPEAKLHVRPHLTPMGHNSSQPSPLGADWQYLSRRYDPPPTPREFYAHILTVVGER